jgi:hypothetical protein
MMHIETGAHSGTVTIGLSTVPEAVDFKDHVRELVTLSADQDIYYSWAPEGAEADPGGNILGISASTPGFVPGAARILRGGSEAQQLVVQGYPVLIWRAVAGTTNARAHITSRGRVA